MSVNHFQDSTGEVVWCGTNSLVQTVLFLLCLKCLDKYFSINILSSIKLFVFMILKPNYKIKLYFCCCLEDKDGRYPSSIAMSDYNCFSALMFITATQNLQNKADFKTYIKRFVFKSHSYMEWGSWK